MSVETKSATLRKKWSEFRDAAEQLKRQRSELFHGHADPLEVGAQIDELLDRYQQLQHAQNDLYLHALDRLSRKIERLELFVEANC